MNVLTSLSLAAVITNATAVVYKNPELRGRLIAMKSTCVSITITDNGEYPICSAFINPDGKYKCFTDYSQTLSFQYDYGGAVNPACVSDAITFPDPASSTWALITEKESDQGYGGFNTPLPSIRISTVWKSETSHPFYMYISCIEPNGKEYKSFDFNINWCKERYCGILTIPIPSAPSLCAAMNSATTAPSMLPSRYPTSIPCWDANITGVGSFPICGVWRYEDSSYRCFEHRLDSRSDDYALTDFSFTYIYGGSSSSPCQHINPIEFPDISAPWTFVDGSDSNNYLGGFSTPSNAIRIQADWPFTDEYGDFSDRIVDVYVECGVAGVAYEEMWCASYCVVITIAYADAPALCDALATATVPLINTSTPSVVPSVSPTKKPLSTVKPSFKPSNKPTKPRKQTNKKTSRKH